MPHSAWVLRANSTAFDLRLERKPTSPSDHLGPLDVLVQVQAVSLNYRDIIGWKNLAGRKLDGRVPASDGAGEVVAVGAEVSRWKIGDRVAGCFFQTWQSGQFDLIHHKNDLGGTLDGMLQEFVTLNESGLVKIPDHLSFRQAATLPCAGLTAWYSLVVRGGLTKGQTVLCLGTGGVSVFALQIANTMGAQVIVTSSDDAKLERARKLGATQTINYKTLPKWSDEVWKLTEMRGADHVVEVGGPGTLEQSMLAVAAGGHIALIGVLTGFGAPSTGLFPLLARNVRLNGIYVGSRQDFIQMNQFMTEHSIEPVIDQEYGFRDAPEAFEALAGGRHFGKIVISVP
jgi:NADPH:quinone reductase-like Zn-dependent oxidoreductase